MELTELTELLTTPADLVKKIETDVKALFNEAEFDQLEPEKHTVFDVQKRKKKEVNKPIEGTNEDGSQKTETTYAEVVRVGLSLQKLIVSRSATFLVGNAPTLEAKPETPAEKTLYDMVLKVWEDNKLDYKNMDIAETMMSQKECAEIWTFDDTEKGYWGNLMKSSSKRLRMTLFKPSEGNTLYPLFNNRRDMVAFARAFKVKVDGKEQQRVDIFTKDKNILLEASDNNWQERVMQSGESENPFGKIPVIWYPQPRSEWQDVQPAIERLEELLSNHGDINDYNGSPAIVASGTIEGFSTKGERGKVFQMGAGADMKYLSWDQAPESIKLEIENLFDIIYTMTQTPNISFKEVKGMGSLSGIAIKLMFMDAHSKARRKQSSIFGECLQRRINLIKAGCIKINPSLTSAANLVIWPKFRDYMPTNELEEAQIEQIKVNTLLRATGEQPILSQEEAVSLNPMEVEDRAADLVKIQAEARAKQLTFE